MPQPIYKLYLLRWKEPWHQLTQAERDSLTGKFLSTSWLRDPGNNVSNRAPSSFSPASKAVSYSRSSAPLRRSSGTSSARPASLRLPC